MKDWAFNRQRYWGEPIPIIYCPNCGMVGVPYEELPLRLPPVENFLPGEDGQSPLARIPEFVNCKCPKCGADAKRETDTMPQWAGSSWYFLRYIDPHNDKALADPEKLKYWMPVDWYNGGMEHVTRHLIYSRFWHHFLYDIGAVNTYEPYAKRTAQGMVLGENGVKMSKSLGNVIDPIDVVDEYGADTLRTYVLFMGEYGKAAPWSEASVRGCKRFLDRVWNLGSVKRTGDSLSAANEKEIHRTIQKVTLDIDEMKFNTAIAQLMSLVNQLYGGEPTREDIRILLQLLSPFAPHIAEELWEIQGFEGLACESVWPVYDESKMVDKEKTIAVQINGKLRSTVVVPADCDQQTILDAALADRKIAGYVAGMEIVKTIVVPNKLLNLILKPGK